MTKSQVLKFADAVTGRSKEPTESKVARAFLNVGKTPDGRVIEQYFLHLMSRTLSEGAPEGALRENEVQRRIAVRIVRMMNEAEPSDDREQADGRRSRSSGSGGSRGSSRKG